MRLPWPFRRTSPERHLDAPAAGQPVQRRAEWRNLPALNETIGPPPLVAPNSRFAGGLSINPPAPTLAPLGHQRSLDAPAGMALGLAKPVNRESDGPAVSSRPVANRSLRQRLQRRVEAGASVPGAPDWADDVEPGSPEAPPPAAAAALAPPMPAAPAPIRRAPTVAREAAIRPASMTTAPADLQLASIAPSAPAGLQRAAAPVPPNYNAVQSARSIRSMLSHGGGAEAGAAPAPPAPIQRAPAAASGASSSAAPAFAPTKLSLAQSRRAGLGAPLTAKPDAAMQRHADGSAESAAPVTASPAGAVQRHAETASSAPLTARMTSTVGGLGSAIQRAPATAAAGPLAEPPALALARQSGAQGVSPVVGPTYTASLQRSAADVDDAPAAAVQRASAMAPLLGSAGSGLTSIAAPGAGSVDTPAESLDQPGTSRPPRLRVQRRRTSDASPDTGSEPSAAADGAPPGSAVPSAASSLGSTQRAPETVSVAPARAALPGIQRAAARTPDGGLFGSRSLLRAGVSATGFQRAPAGAASPSAAGAPVRVLRDASVAGTASQLKAKAFTHAGDVYLPAHHGPLDSGPARSLLAHELTHVQQQRDYGSSLPAEHTLDGQRLERAAQAAESRASAPLNLPLATPASPRQSRSAAVAQRSAAAVSTSDDGQADEGPAGPQPGTTGSTLVAAPVQRDSEATASAAAPAAPTPAAGTADDPESLDKLATKLWERLHHRMRRELLSDRERAGMAADLSR